ncbi:MAG: hypothetical protein Kow0042_23860 [Calditrichia bacterium]
MAEEIIPKHGGYRKLKTFQLVQLIYDLTVRFCDRYIDKRSRTAIKWCRRRAPGYKTLPKAARPAAPPRK